MAVVKAKVKNPTKKVDLPVPADVVIDDEANSESEPELESESEPEQVAVVKPKKAVATKKEKVKRAPSAYNNFVSAKIREMRLEKPGLAPTEYMKLVSTMWKTASDAEKKVFAT
jgi:hypothetical protein